jgi:hypothetical protein
LKRDIVWVEQSCVDNEVAEETGIETINAHYTSKHVNAVRKRGGALKGIKVVVKLWNIDDGTIFPGACFLYSH